MGRTELTLKTLEEFDNGKAAIALQNVLQRAVSDCMDRGEDPSRRKVVLEIGVTPIVIGGGIVEEVRLDFKIKAAIPCYSTISRPVGVTRKGQLVFNPEAPDNPNQKTIGDVLDADND